MSKGTLIRPTKKICGLKHLRIIFEIGKIKPLSILLYVAKTDLKFKKPI